MDLQNSQKNQENNTIIKIPDYSNFFNQILYVKMIELIDINNNPFTLSYFTFDKDLFLKQTEFYINENEFKLIKNNLYTSIATPYFQINVINDEDLYAYRILVYSINEAKKEELENNLNTNIKNMLYSAGALSVNEFKILCANKELYILKKEPTSKITSKLLKIHKDEYINLKSDEIFSSYVRKNNEFLLEPIKVQIKLTNDRTKLNQNKDPINRVSCLFISFAFLKRQNFYIYYNTAQNIKHNIIFTLHIVSNYKLSLDELNKTYNELCDQAKKQYNQKFIYYKDNSLSFNIKDKDTTINIEPNSFKRYFIDKLDGNDYMYIALSIRGITNLLKKEQTKIAFLGDDI